MATDFAKPTTRLERNSIATIHPRRLPWLRALWVLVALNSLITFGWALYFTRQFSLNLPGPIVAGLQELGVTNEFYFWVHALLIVLDFVTYFGIGCLIFIMRPTERMAWLASIFLTAFGIQNVSTFSVEYSDFLSTAPLLYRVNFFMNNLFSYTLLPLFFAAFPTGRIVPRWMIYFVIYFVIFCGLWGIFPDQFGVPQGAFSFFVYGSEIVMFLSVLYAQVWRYRNYSSPMEKQQAKWLIFGLGFTVCVLVLPIFALFALAENGVLPPLRSVDLELVGLAINVFILFLPVTIGFAILRYRLWDIDIIIRRTLTYALLTAFLIAIYFGAVIFLQRLFSILTGVQQNEIVTVLSTLAIAALFVPLRNRIQEWIDRRFYRKKYDAQVVLQKFSETVRDETDLDKLNSELMNVVQETMQPTSMSMWLKAGGRK